MVVIRPKYGRYAANCKPKINNKFIINNSRLPIQLLILDFYSGRHGDGTRALRKHLRFSPNRCKKAVSGSIIKTMNFRGRQKDLEIQPFRLYDDCDKIPIDRDYIRIGYFELLKTELRNEHQRFWQMYFLDRNVPPEAPEYIRRAGKLIEIANLGKEERYMLSLEEKYAADQHALFSTARSEGMAEGMVKVARKLKDEGAVMSLIVKVTGLSEQEIEAL